MTRQHEIDMTKGSIAKNLILFSIPIVIGSLFQQLYNTVDSVVVGNYVGKEALAAVGGVSPILNMLIGFFTGLATGAGVVISQYYGARDKVRVHAAVQTTMAMSLVLCVVLTAAGILTTPVLLRMMKTPDDVIDMAAEYLRIYYIGLSGLLLYNIGSGILRAVGDSRRPLYFLIFSALVNTVLDIVFVRDLNMGIAGAAIATTIAQFLSAILVLFVLVKDKNEYRVDLRHIRFDWPILQRICSIGMPTAVQSGVLSVSNAFVQAYINRFGSACMAGWSCYNKVDAFSLIPLTALTTANTIFVSQNLGAGDWERARRGTRCSLWMGFAATVLTITPCIIFAPQIVGLFNRDPEVIRYGAHLVRLFAPFFLICVPDNVYRGTVCGAGVTKACMYMTLGSYVVFRQVYLFVVSHVVDNFTAVALGYPLGWALCTILIVIYYWKGDWKKQAVL